MRAAWRSEVQQLDPQSLVFVDECMRVAHAAVPRLECGSHISLTREYARAPRGQRAVGSVPRNRGSNLTLLAALSPTAIGAEMAIEGAVDREVLEVWVRKVLLPWLRPSGSGSAAMRPGRTPTGTGSDLG